MSEKVSTPGYDYAVQNFKNPSVHWHGWGKKLTPSVQLEMKSKPTAHVYFTSTSDKELSVSEFVSESNKRHCLSATGAGNIMALQEALAYAAEALLKLLECSEGLK